MKTKIKLDKIDKKTFKLIVAGAGVLAIIIVAISFGFSFGGKPQGGPQAPLYIIHDEASFQTHSKTYRVEPPLTPKYAFEVNLPPEWTVETPQDIDTQFGQRIISEIARVSGPYISIYRPQLFVQTMTLTHDIAADTWLRNYILSNSYILQGDVTPVNARNARAAFTYTKDNEVTLVQSVVQFSGATAVIARYEIPFAFKEALGFVQKRSMESFKLLAVEETPVEEQKPLTLVDLVKFSYPQSWSTSSPDLRDVNRISIQLYHQSAARIFQGYMHFFVVKRRPETDIDQESQRLRDFVAETMKLNIETLKSSTTAAPNARFSFSRQEDYSVTSTARPNTAPQELTLTMLGNSNIYVFVLMLSPDPARDMYSWARNRRALELITQSLE